MNKESKPEIKGYGMPEVQIRKNIEQLKAWLKNKQKDDGQKKTKVKDNNKKNDEKK